LSHPTLSSTPRASRDSHAARVSLLIPTHALPPLSYLIPERLRGSIRVGTAVTAPLSGRLRLGVVLATDTGDSNAREVLRDAVAGLSLPPDLVELCGWVSEAAAVPLPVVLRTALPPGVDTGWYRVLDPAPGWPYNRGDLVRRASLRRSLGPEGLRTAEAEGSITLVPTAPEPATVEWAFVVEGSVPDLDRAPRQRQLFDVLGENGGACATATLLSEAGAARSALRELVRKGAVRLVRSPEPAPIFAAREEAKDLDSFLRRAEPAVRRGGACVWRMPSADQPGAVAALARATVEGGEQALVLAPEIETAERLVVRLRRALTAGCTVAPYHSGLGHQRTAVYEAARAGRVDVVVGTRTAALLPLLRLGAICVADEPNASHRAQAGYEGLPIHVRDVALERGRIEGAGVFCLSPFPSLRLIARKPTEVREMPARRPERWPSVRIVDMRGSGATLSTTVLDACRRVVEEGGRVGVTANRLRYAVAVTCNGCGTVRSCSDCDLPLVLYERAGLLVCDRCGHREKITDGCGVCGSDRVSPVGLTVERVREELSRRLDAQVGLITAGERELEDAPIVVGTARVVLDEKWDAVLLPDADSALLGTAIGAVERAFRLVYRAAETARKLLLIQTRLPEHYALREAVRGDYPAFAAAELPRLRSSGYPPFAHLASVTLEGPGPAVRRAVESRLRPAVEPAVEVSGPVLIAHTGGHPRWRVLLRSGERPVVARAATLAARLSAQIRELKVRVDVDPEEV
jgi:primosomal protein N' (replication factor Y) (superfamily II helicase)